MRKELARFLVVGLTTVAIDFLVYRLLVVLNLDTASAKATGFIAGTVFAYFANRLWTFGAKDTPVSGSVLRFALLYSSTLACNVGVNAAMLDLLQGWPYVFQSAFVVATGVSATLNFFGMKYLVFRQIPAVART